MYLEKYFLKREHFGNGFRLPNVFCIGISKFVFRYRESIIPCAYVFLFKCHLWNQGFIIIDLRLYFTFTTLCLCIDLLDTMMEIITYVHKYIPVCTTTIWFWKFKRWLSYWKMISTFRSNEFEKLSTFIVQSKSLSERMGYFQSLGNHNTVV